MFFNTNIWDLCESEVLGHCNIHAMEKHEVHEWDQKMKFSLDQKVELKIFFEIYCQIWS